MSDDEPVFHERRARADMAEDLFRRTRDREVRLLVGELPEAEREVLVRRWGLMGEARTLAEVAHALGVSEELAAEREADGLTHLAELLAGRDDLRPG